MHTYFQVQVVDFKDQMSSWKKEHKIDYKKASTAGIDHSS